MVSVLVPDPDVEDGNKTPVAPDGNPDTPKLTVPLKPFSAVTVSVYAVPFPALTLCVPGVRPSE